MALEYYHQARDVVSRTLNSNELNVNIISTVDGRKKDD